MSSSPKRERIAQAVAEHLDNETFVNVGIGIPGLVPHHVADERRILFHAEHGVVGFGSDRFGPDDGAEVAFFGTTYRLRPWSFVSDHARSFAMVRSGLLDATVLGTFEVGADGRFANFQSAEMSSGCPGGSPELAGSAKRVILATEHTDKRGRPKLVASTDLAVGIPRAADLVVTDLGSFVPAGDYFRVERLAEGATMNDVEAATDAPVVMA